MTNVTKEELAAPNGSALIGHSQTGTGATTRTVREKLNELFVP
jgi:hypothetical protein